MEKRNFVYNLWIQKPARYCKVFSSFSGKLQSFGSSSNCLQPERSRLLTHTPRYLVESCHQILLEADYLEKGHKI